MKKYCAKILVNTKSTVKDIKSLTIKQAIENLLPIEDLSCKVGSLYILSFSATNQCEALHKVEKISMDLLANEAVEDYEIRSLEEVYE